MQKTKKLLPFVLLCGIAAAGARDPRAANAAPQATGETILFQDNFDTDSSANWNVFDGSANGVSDFTVQWAFDYSTNRYTSNGVSLLIPPAPNSSGTSRGVKLTVNNNDDVAATAAVNLYPKNRTFSGNYALRFDLWMNYTGTAGNGTGSTEHTLFGINHSGDKVNWPSSTVSSSDGIFFAVAGEAGSGTPRDYVNYEGDPSGSPLRFSGASGGFIDHDGDGTPDDEVPSHAGLTYLFPAPPYETLGAPGKRWVQVEVRQRGGTVTWLINGYVIAEKQSELGWSSGNIMIGLADLFSSIANPRADQFVIFDNVRVVSLGDTPLPRVSVEATIPNAAEPSSNGAFTITRTGDTAQALAVGYRLTGTATAGQDYSAVPLTTNIPAGANSIVIPITVIDDQRAEPAETVRLVINATNGVYEVGTGATAQIEIADDNDPTAVSITATDPWAYEGIPSDVAVFRITRIGDLSPPLTVNFTTSGAQPGVDFQPLGTSATIPAGADFALLTLVPINNSVVDSNRVVTVQLAAGTGYALGTPASATATIRDDDGRTPGPVLFSDNFDTDTSAQWTVNAAHPDINRATFNWDYSTFGIPAAPHSTNGSTKGLRLEANFGGPGTFTGLSVSPTGKGFEGDYRLSFDMWINYNGPLLGGGSGSTMMLSAGVGTSGTVAQFPGTSVEGVLFAATGDGGAAEDWRAYVATGAPLTPDTGAYAAGTASGVRNNTDPYYAPFGRASAPQAQLNLFPEQTGATAVGAPGIAWHEVSIEKRGTNISWFVDNLRIATVTLTNKQISTNIFVGFFDINAGNAGNQDLRFGLVDNLRVERLSGTPSGEVRITAVRRNGANMEIDFAAPDGFSSFVVEGSATVNGQYAPETAAQISTVSGNLRRATVPISGGARFFRVRGQ